MRRIVFLLIPVLLMIYLLAGCMAGGTMGSGLPGGQRGFGVGGQPAHDLGADSVRYVMARGSVVGENGLPLRDAEITVKTGLGSEYIRVDESGKFEVSLPVGASDKLTFQINSGPKSGEVVTKGFGVGVEAVLFHFKLMNSGKVIWLNPPKAK